MKRTQPNTIRTPARPSVNNNPSLGPVGLDAANSRVTRDCDDDTEAPENDRAMPEIKIS